MLDMPRSLLNFVLVVLVASSTIIVTEFSLLGRSQKNSEANPIRKTSGMITGLGVSTGHTTGARVLQELN